DAGGALMNFVDPVAKRHRRSTVDILQHDRYRHAAVAQVRHEAVLLAQRGRGTHTAVMALDEKLPLPRFDQACRRQRTRTVPRDAQGRAQLRVTPQQRFEFGRRNRRPVRARGDRDSWGARVTLPTDSPDYRRWAPPTLSARAGIASNDDSFRDLP